MKPLLIFMGVVFSIQSYANSCLSSASNSELLSEVQRRMSGQSGETGDSSVMFMATCSNGYLSVKTIKVSSGDIHSIINEYYGSSICEEYAASLRSINDSQLIRSIIISTCPSSYLTKTLINTKGESRTISSDYVGSACKDQAIEQNRKLGPMMVSGKKGLL